MHHVASHAEYKTKTLLAWNLLADLFAGRLDEVAGLAQKPAQKAALAALHFGTDSYEAEDSEEEEEARPQQVYIHTYIYVAYLYIIYIYIYIYIYI
jgi:hypothetical protein